MPTLLHTLFHLAVGCLLGGMVFFPSVVAPRVFRVLEPDDAGRFLRALFPAYYLYLIITADRLGTGLYQPNIYKK